MKKHLRFTLAFILIIVMMLCMMPTGSASAQPDSFLLEDVVDALCEVYYQYLETDTVPSSIKIGSTIIDKPSYAGLAAFAILRIYNEQTSSPVPYFPCTVDAGAQTHTYSLNDIAQNVYILNLAGMQASAASVGALYPTLTTPNGNYGYQQMIPLFAEVLAVYKVIGSLPAYANAVKPSTTPKPSYAAFTVYDMARRALVQAERIGEFPAYVFALNLSGPSVVYEYIRMEDFFKLAVKAIQQLNVGNTGAVPLLAASDATQNQRTYIDSFDQQTLSKSAYMNTVSRNITHITDMARLATYVTYPTQQYYATYDFTGNFSFIRGCFTYARILDYYYSYLTLPNEIDCTIPDESYHHQEPQAFIPLISVTYALAGVYNYYLTYGVTPASITIGGITANRASYFRLAIQAIVNIQADRTGDVPYYACTNPTGGAYDSFSSASISKYAYLNAAQRQLVWMNDHNNTPANVVDSPVDPRPGYHYTGQFTYEDSLISFAYVLGYYDMMGILPSTVNVP